MKKYKRREFLGLATTGLTIAGNGKSEGFDGKIANKDEIVKINSAKLIYFSPTGTTKKVLESIAQGMKFDTVEQLDMTPPEARKREFEEMHDELAIIGTPVYGGRVPIYTAQRLQRLRANGTPAVIVVVYGNRLYVNALLELKDIAVEIGYKPFAGMTFIGEHSFSNETTPIANGRPDAEDIKKAKEFGTMIRKKMRNIHAIDYKSPLQVPGNFPYGDRWKKPPNVSPITKEILCKKCGKCASVCPTAAITINDTVMTDTKACILCHACVKNCPTRARVVESPQIKRIAELLSKKYRARKEPEIYVGF